MRSDKPFVLLPVESESDRMDTGKMGQNLRDYKSDKWWSALRSRKERNRHHYTGIWLKNGKTYSFDLVVKGQRYRRGGFKTPEEAALARDCVIVANNLPHKRAFSEDHFKYYVDRFGFYELKIDVPGGTSPF